MELRLNPGVEAGWIRAPMTARRAGPTVETMLLPTPTITTTAAAVEVRGLHVRYGDVEAVRGIDLVVRRGEKLKIDHIFVGVSDKLTCMRKLLEELGLSLEQVAYIGDDVNDYELLCNVGLAVAVRDASRLPKSVAHLVTEAKGGEGAVRELCEIILEAQQEQPPLPEA